MEVGSQEWIENSLAKLETLEQERDDHEAALETATDADALRVHSEAIERLDEEIKSLYAQLESVAEEEDEASDPDDAAATNEFQREEAVAEPSPAAVSAAAAPADDLPDNPFGAPAAAAAPAAMDAGAGFGDPGAGFGDDGFGGGDASIDFDPPKSGAGKWVVLGLLIAGGGVGGYLYLNQQKAPEPAPQAPTEVKVIEAKAVPEDTQGPKGAEGADVDVTPGMDRSTKKRGGGSRGGGGGGGGGGGNKGKSNSGRDKKIKLSDSDDPLG